LGSDIETYHTAVRLQVYKPVGDALATMVNYISPVRENAAKEEAERMGLQNALPSFPIGSVRYTSTQRLQKELNQDGVVFNIQSVDFLARRTGVFGMTRTGKSNMIKQLVSVVKRTADETDMKIGQIIYDLNGEYANANQQDADPSLQANTQSECDHRPGEYADKVRVVQEGCRRGDTFEVVLSQVFSTSFSGDAFLFRIHLREKHIDGRLKRNAAHVLRLNHAVVFIFGRA